MNAAAEGCQPPAKAPARRGGLPVLGSRAKIRPSRSAPRRLAVLVGVHVLVAIHIVHWRLQGSSLSPLEPSEAMELAKHNVVNAGLIFFAATIIATALFGRFFCGWGCHLVALQDASAWLLARIGIRPRPLRSRLLALVPLLAFAYMFLWPVAYRLWRGDRFDHLEVALTKPDFWSTFPGWVIALLTFFVCGFVAIYFLGAKGFCTYACPYGAIFGVADRVAPGRIRVTDACEGCGHCTAVCTSNVRVHEEVRSHGMVVDPGCMKCMDCVSVCPKDALYFGFGRPSLGAPARVAPKPRRSALGWGEETFLGIAFFAAFFTFRGLYEALPFLLSLGMAAVLACLSLYLARLFYRPHLALRRWQLKRAGRWLPAGQVFAALGAVVLIFWAHSAWVHYHAWRGRVAFGQTLPFRGRALVPDDRVAPLTPSQQGQAEDALAHLSAAAEHGLVTPPRRVVQLAWMARLAGDRAAFERWGGRALAVRSEQGTPYLLLGGYHVEGERFGDALTAYQQAVAVEPTNVNTHLALGMLQARLGQLEAAGASFEGGLEKAPTSPELTYNAGLIRAYQGDLLGAIARFRAALDLEPRYLEARENLAGALASSGQFHEAIEHYRKAIEQAPDDAATRILLARALLALDDRANAEKQLAQAIALDPSLAQTFTGLDDLTAPMPP